MGKVKDQADQFLKNGGRGLGYSEDQLPEIKDMDHILKVNVKVWEYCGMTQEEYYGEDTK